MNKKKLRVLDIILSTAWLLWCLLGWLRIFPLPVFIIVACVLYIPVVYTKVKLWAAERFPVIALLLILVYPLGIVLTIGMDIYGIKIPRFVGIFLVLSMIAGNVVLFVSLGHKWAKGQSKDSL